MDIEQLAVIRISEFASRCPSLRANITVNDKTPFTDGHIDIYSSQGQYSKDNFEGRVPVQVKGRFKPPRNRNRPSFQIPRADLNGYLRERGVLYFVVYIDQATGDSVRYYNNLSPFKIDALLRKAKPTTTNITVRLARLPSEPSSFEALLRFALRTRDEDLNARASEKVWKNLQSITLYAPESLDFSKPQTLNPSELDFSIFVRTVDGMELPADGVLMIAPQEYFGVSTDYIVSAGDYQFRNPIRRQIDDSTVELVLSAGLRTTLRDRGAGGAATVALDVQNNLGARILDLGFFLSCMDDSGFHIDDTLVGFTSGTPKDLAELRAHFAYLTVVREVFEHLEANPHLVDLESVSPRQLDQLARLHSALVREEEVEQDFETPGRVLQPLGDWSIELLCVRGERDGWWRYIDLFGSDNGYQLSQKIENGATEFVRITPYEVVNEDRLARTLNLHLPSIVDAFKEVADYPEAISRATATVLRLIAAADDVAQRRSEFLRAASDLNEWLARRATEESAHRINRWQISARTGHLTDEHRAEIRDLRYSARRGELATDLPLLVEISCNILLGDSSEVDFLLTKLSPERLELLKTWPIWTLFERGLNLDPPSRFHEWRGESLKAIDRAGGRFG